MKQLVPARAVNDNWCYCIQNLVASVWVIEACQIVSDSKQADAVQGYEMDLEAWTPRGNLKDTLALAHWEKALSGKGAATGNTQKVTTHSKDLLCKMLSRIQPVLAILAWVYKRLQIQLQKPNIH